MAHLQHGATKLAMVVTFTRSTQNPSASLCVSADLHAPWYKATSTATASNVTYRENKATEGHGMPHRKPALRKSPAQQLILWPREALQLAPALHQPANNRGRGCARAIRSMRRELV